MPCNRESAAARCAFSSRFVTSAPGAQAQALAHQGSQESLYTALSEIFQSYDLTTGKLKLSGGIGPDDRSAAGGDDRPRLASSLMGRGTIVSLSVLQATAPAPTPPDARRDLEEALRLARELHSPQEEAWASWSLGLLQTVSGHFGPALEMMRSGLQIASNIKHEEWEVGNRFALGILYAEMLAPDEARQHLEEALRRAKGLRSQYWINHVRGALATAYMLLDHLTEAQTCLESVLTPQTAMDTMGKRYCWARRAELALLQGDPILALDIVERLTASARGMTAEGVITFLWMLGGEASAAMGRGQEACSLLLAAIENARVLGERFLLWRVHASLGRLYGNLDRQAEARQEFSTARELVGKLAATVPDESLRDNFLQRDDDMLGLD